MKIGELLKQEKPNVEAHLPYQYHINQPTLKTVVLSYKGNIVVQQTNAATSFVFIGPLVVDFYEIFREDGATEKGELPMYYRDQIAVAGNSMTIQSF